MQGSNAFAQTLALAKNSETSLLNTVVTVNCPICNQQFESAAIASACAPCEELLIWFRNHFAREAETARQQIDPNTSFLDLGVDSLDYVDWLAEAEREFGISLSEREAETLQKVMSKK